MGLTVDEDANELVVDLVRPAADFVTVVAGPTFGIVPPGVGRGGRARCRPVTTSWRAAATV